MKATVLIAEDEPTSLRLLEATLQRHGYATRSVTDGAQAWEVLQGEASPAIAVLDWNMPGLDGPEVCRRVRQLKGRPYLYLILITARGDVEATVAGREAGADDFIHKPFHPLDLLARLHVGERIIAAFIERSRAEEALRLSEDRTRAVIENMPTGLLIINEQGRIQAVNGAAERIFGYSRDELVEQPLAMLVVESVGNRGKMIERDKRLEPGRAWEWEGRRKSGEVFPFELIMYELPGGDERWFAVKIRDISERREVDQLKNEFVSTVSHELRTPLTAIMGALALLKNGVVGTVDVPARELIQIAHANAERLIRLVNDILDFEKIEAGRLDLKLVEIEPARLVAATIDNLRNMAQTVGVRLVSEERTPLKVRGDFDRLIQVLTNLVSNAIKFSPPQSEVVVRIESEFEQWVRISVADQGRGIPPEQQHKLFGRFQQLEAGEQRKKGGTGLGLAISKAIVELHRGKIGVDSQVGRGSTFWFELPVEGPGTAHIS